MVCTKTIFIGNNSVVVTTPYCNRRIGTDKRSRKVNQIIRQLGFCRFRTNDIYLFCSGEIDSYLLFPLATLYRQIYIDSRLTRACGHHHQFCCNSVILRSLHHIFISQSLLRQYMRCIKTICTCLTYLVRSIDSHRFLIHTIDTHTLVQNLLILILRQIPIHLLTIHIYRRCPTSWHIIFSLGAIKEFHAHLIRLA